ncbi:AraC-type DNA-binding protein [Niabella drilacis]|uniref:AraC-type DNA-binding protein n=2 Tax=Niabella drilacis (strain DSM 25811 / CCM 8410 / CCUG 62505 / LMG 26954 / E90) TaxID=1285928 RepID=A0A1G6I7Y9_NIADE|nr:AraC-type DNA-binding protein [Niabella drilacis]
MATPGASFAVRRDQAPVNSRWHCHKEAELIYIARGTGTLLIGDHTRYFSAGTLCLIGSRLPHYWKFDECYFEKNAPIDVIAIHFHETFWGKAFLDLPENEGIRLLLQKARRGLLIHGNIQPMVPSFHYLVHAEGPYRIISLATLLSKIADWGPVTSLSSENSCLSAGNFEGKRIHEVYEYTVKHFRRKIPLPEIARVAHVSPHAFSRYFRQRARKTYSQFIAELRVGYVCRQLVTTDHPIKRLCYESGFQNTASFHKCFKQITGMSPLSYQQVYK